MHPISIFTITVSVTDGSLINCYTGSVVYYNSKREGENVDPLQHHSEFRVGIRLSDKQQHPLCEISRTLRVGAKQYEETLPLA